MYNFCQIKGLKTDVKAKIEDAIVELFVFCNNTNSETTSLLFTYFNFCILSDENTIDFGGENLQKLPPSIVMQVVNRSCMRIENQDRMQALYRTILKRKFMYQKFVDYDSKYFAKLSVDSTFTIKNFETC